MNILVCFKVTPEWESFPETEWDGFSAESDIDYIRKTINCFDESALEIALRIRDGLIDNSCTLTAVTIGTFIPTFIRRNLFAVGYDRIIRIDKSVEFAPEETASVLAAYLENADFGLILTGKEAGMAETGQVPVRLATKLGIPFVTEAEDIEMMSDSKKIRIGHRTDYGKIYTDAVLPLLAAVGNSSVSALRAATLRSQMQAADKTEEVIVPSGQTARKMPEVVLIRPKRDKTCVFAESNDPDILSDILLSNISEITETVKTAEQEGNHDARVSVPDGVSGFTEISLESENTASEIDRIAALYDASKLERSAPQILILPSGISGKEISAGLSERLGIPYYSKISIAEDENGILTFQKRVCGSNMIWRQELPNPPYIVTFAAATTEERNNLLLVGGKGLGSKESCEELRKLAAELGANVGFSRAVVVNGWGYPEEIIGQSGIITEPKCCITFGVSGAAAFAMGIEQAEKIIAVNIDSHAPIFRLADDGIVTDAPILLRSLKKKTEAEN